MTLQQFLEPVKPLLEIKDDSFYLSKARIESFETPERTGKYFVSREGRSWIARCVLEAVDEVVGGDEE